MERLSKEIVVDKGELYLLSRPGRRRAEPAFSVFRKRTDLKSLLNFARRHSFYVRLTPLATADLDTAVNVVVELARYGCTASLVSTSAGVPSPWADLY